MITEMTKLHELFKGVRIVGLAGEKHSGKSNNICQMLIEYISIHKSTPIYIYGFAKEVTEVLSRYGIKEISSLDQLIGKKNCILVLDEFQKLKLNDRRYKEDLSELVDFVYHNGVYLLLSSPNIREFNSIIGGIIEKWALKTVRIDQAVNGSQLKKVIENYKGRHKSLGSIHTEKDTLLLINTDYEQIIKVDYNKECDNKRNVKNLF